MSERVYCIQREQGDLHKRSVAKVHRTIFCRDRKDKLIAVDPKK